MQNRYPIDPKPFEKIRIQDAKSSRPIQGWDKFHQNRLSGRIKLQIHCITPVHVGSGLFTQFSGQICRDLVRNRGHYVIPGSSIKGAVRSAVESISASCLRIVNRAVAERLADDSWKSCKQVERDKNEKLCPACSIFGALGFRGKVHFTDAVPVEPYSLQLYRLRSAFTPRETASVYKDRSGRYDGRKAYLHGEIAGDQGQGEPYLAFLPETDLNVMFSFEDLSRAELGLVLIAMGVRDGLYAKIGGAKHAMFGSVAFEPLEAVLRNPDPRLAFASARRFIRFPGPAEDDYGNLQEFANGADGLLQKEQYEQYAELNTFDPNNPAHKAPENMY